MKMLIIYAEYDADTTEFFDVIADNKLDDFCNAYILSYNNKFDKDGLICSRNKIVSYNFDDDSITFRIERENDSRTFSNGKTWVITGLCIKRIDAMNNFVNGDFLTEIS